MSCPQILKQALLCSSSGPEEKNMWIYDKHNIKLHLGTGMKCFKIALVIAPISLLLLPW